MRFVPERNPSGGSMVGNSYCSTFTNCPWEWFQSYYRPIFNDEGQVIARGIRPKFTSEPLNRGTVFHEGMAALYQSGVKDGEDTGEWDIEFAVDKAESTLNNLASTYENPDSVESHRVAIQERLRAYYDAHGPNAANPDWPNIRVVVDGRGKPLIEREWVVSLGYGDYIYTSKTDLVVQENGFLKVFEHKTSAPGFWLNQRRASCHTDSQFTGELFVLRNSVPEEEVSSVVANIIVFGARAGGQVAIREPTKRNAADMEQFRVDTVDILSQIDSRTEAFDNSLEKSGDLSLENINRIGGQNFPSHGTRTGRCQAFRGCWSLYWCSRKGREAESMKSYEPKTLAEISQAKEQS